MTCRDTGGMVGCLSSSPPARLDVEQMFAPWYSGGEKTVSLAELKGQPRALAAAQVIQERALYSVLTESELRAAAQALDGFENRGPEIPARYENLSKKEQELLRQQIPALRAAVHPPLPAVEPLDFCVSLNPSAIPNPELRRCAEIAAQFGTAVTFGPQVAPGGTPELTAQALRKAREALEHSSAAAADLLATDADRQAFSGQNLELLETFFALGKGGILESGPINIHGHCFEQVYRLPGGTFDSNNLAAAIKDYEERFARCGYDRIYILDPVGNLSVALNEAGSLEGIQTKDRVQLVDPATGSADQTGTVVFVWDINNSLKEATLGFWTDLPGQISGRFRQYIGTSVDDGIKKVVEDTSHAACNPAVPQPAGNPQSQWWLLGGMGAAAGTLALSAPAVASVLGALGLIITLSNIAEYVGNVARRNKVSIYQAMGVTLQRADPIRD